MNHKQRLYLDVCTLCRPFDDQTMMRIRLETAAYYLILQKIEEKQYELMVSPVHGAEIRDIDDIRERLELTILLKKYGIEPSYRSHEIRKRAEQLFALGFGVADAVHAAFAEITADIFITCDDRLRKKCAKATLKIGVMNPVDFCLKENLK